MGSSMCRRCGAEEETLVHVFCECKALVTRRHTYLGSFFFDPENVKGLSVRATEGLSKAYMYQDRKASNPLSFLLRR